MFDYLFTPRDNICFAGMVSLIYLYCQHNPCNNIIKKAYSRDERSVDIRFLFNTFIPSLFSSVKILLLIIYLQKKGCVVVLNFC